MIWSQRKLVISLEYNGIKWRYDEDNLDECQDRQPPGLFHWGGPPNYWCHLLKIEPAPQRSTTRVISKIRGWLCHQLPSGWSPQMSCSTNFNSSAMLRDNYPYSHYIHTTISIVILVILASHIVDSSAHPFPPVGPLLNRIHSHPLPSQDMSKDHSLIQSCLLYTRYISIH